MKIYYPKLPIKIYGDISLVYDYSYSKPIKHYKFERSVTNALKKVITGAFTHISFGISKKIMELGLIGSISIPFIDNSFDLIVLDFSIGGPSLWGKNVHEFLLSKGKNTLFFSYSRKEFILKSKNIYFEKDFIKKIGFISISRRLLSVLDYENILIIGRDCAARMIDILDEKKTVIVETGYGEDSIPNIERIKAKENLIIEELLFRENIYPWDSFSNVYAHSQCLQKFKNVFWSELKLRSLKEKFPQNNFFFQPPNIFLNYENKIIVEDNKKIKILVGLGNHQTGENSIEFLNLKPLFFMAKEFEEEVIISIVSKDEGNLRKYIKSNNIILKKYTKQDQFFKLLKSSDIYYRVQNDSSIPISVIEAMANRCICIINESCKQTWSKLINFENIVFVKHGSLKSLQSSISEILKRNKSLSRIKDNSQETVNNYCNAEKYLKEMELI